MKNYKEYISGFTLMETIIYIALLSIIMYGALVTSFELVDAAGVLQARATIEEEGNFVLRKINWAFTSLDAANPPVVGGGGCLQTLTIYKTNYSHNPIILHMKSTGEYNYIQIKEGASDIPITTENASTTCLKFGLISGSPIGVTATATISGIDFTITKYLRK
jgi:type II secretory pathway pseudopilin PulG